MAKNSKLNAAKSEQNNEFYTQYEDIQKELNHYVEHFKGKTVLCNCDDPFESNFCKFFLKNFNFLGLKRLICTSYVSSPVVGTQMSIFDMLDEPVKQGHGYVMDISEVPMANGRGVSDDDIEKLLHSKKRGVKRLTGNGDFRSEECVDYLKQADIVVTNPPFSLLVDYFALLMKYNKKFLIIGTQNAVTYKDIFPLIKENKVWWGVSNCIRWFIIPNASEKKYKLNSDGDRIAEGDRSRWWTNLDNKKRHEDIVLYRRYYDDDGKTLPDNNEIYPTYKNYPNCIEIGRPTKDGGWQGDVEMIPCDYMGEMGVPITFLDKYNPDQFEIVGISLELAQPMKDFAPKGTYMPGGPRFYTNRLSDNDKARGYKYHREYDRIVIRRKR